MTTWTTLTSGFEDTSVDYWKNVDRRSREDRTWKRKSGNDVRARLKPSVSDLARMHYATYGDPFTITVARIFLLFPMLLRVLWIFHSTIYTAARDERDPLYSSLCNWVPVLFELFIPRSSASVVNKFLKYEKIRDKRRWEYCYILIGDCIDR